MRRDFEPHRAGLVLTLGILSIVLLGPLSVLGLPFGITAWALGHRDLKRMDAYQMDPRGRTTTRAGKICGIVGTLLSGLCSCFFGYTILHK
jgi:hypothetical protein